MATRKRTLLPAPLPLAPDEGLTSLAELPQDTLLFTKGLCKVFGRSANAITDAVHAGQLPPPVWLWNVHVWTVGAILSHLHGRLHDALLLQHQAEHEREQKVRHLEGRR